MKSTLSMNDRLFIGVFATGISYADRMREEHGDYAKLAFLPYDTLLLKVYENCPANLLAKIEASTASIQARRGERFQISSSGQTVMLGIIDYTNRIDPTNRQVQPFASFIP